MSTDASNASILLPVDEFLKRVDWRSVAQLVSDSASTVTEGSLTTDENLLAAIKDACGELEAAALKGERYSAADLAGLTGMSQGFMYRLLTRLTILFLHERRPDFGPMPDFYEDTMTKLNMLASGDRIFGYSEHADAGHPDHFTDNEAIVTDIRKTMTSKLPRFFGRRMTRME